MKNYHGKSKKYHVKVFVVIHNIISTELQEICTKEISFILCYENATETTLFNFKSQTIFMMMKFAKLS